VQQSWAIKKTQEMRINVPVAEMKMLTFACGYTRLDKIENKEIRNRMGKKTTNNPI
jgi:hypothetical protein